jgi:hypothetical protein
MPVLECNELLAIGKYLIEKEKIPIDMQDLYSEENIKKRFEEYGGIYRHVLPTSKSYLNQIKVQKRNVIDGLTREQMNKLISAANIEDPDISDFLQ